MKKIESMTTTELKKMWNKYKDEEGLSPVFAAQVKAAAKELKKRKEKLNEQNNYFMNSTEKNLFNNLSVILPIKTILPLNPV